jgi:hypothetical protein
MEILNPGTVRVYSSGTLAGASSDISLDTLMGLTTLGWSSGGDISCLYDYDNGGHWFITEFVGINSEARGGVFTSCFAGVPDTCLEGIAVSVSANPLGFWNVYFYNPNAVNHDPGSDYATGGHGTLLNDFLKIGNTRDALLMGYDEFNLGAGPSCPSYGCYFGVNGAQEVAIDKKALELGWVTSSVFFTFVEESLGMVPTPDTHDGWAGCTPNVIDDTFGVPCWFQVIPAQSPDPTQFDNNKGGMGFMLGALDFFGFGDTRVAAFAWYDLSALNSYRCSLCGNIGFAGGLVLNTNTPYLDEGANCDVGAATNCGIASQKSGPTPLGDVAYGVPEQGLATNGDGFTQVSYADGLIWGAVSTLVCQTSVEAQTTATELNICAPPSGPSDGPSGGNPFVGAAYWDITAAPMNSFMAPSVRGQGLVAAIGENMEFPSIAASDGGTSLMAFTLSGPSFFPSVAYGVLGPGAGGVGTGFLGSTIHVVALGQSPYDGGSEYAGCSVLPCNQFTSGDSGWRPRYGDYSWAIFMPTSPGSAHGSLVFANEYIQFPNCSDAQFAIDPSCNGIRGHGTNWGSGISELPI